LVLEIFDGDVVVIVETTLGRNVFSPVVGVSFEDDALAWCNTRDAIWAAADNRLQSRPVERLHVESMFWHDRRHRDDQWKFAVGFFVEREPDTVRTRLLKLF